LGNVDLTEGRDPELWEAGCLNDDVRKNVILPDLADRIVALGAHRCCDIGAGTGFVVRELTRISELASIRWTLLEFDDAMLAFARAKVGRCDRIEVVAYDVLNPSMAYDEKFDLAICCFASLEFGMSRTIAQTIMKLVRPGGSFVIYLPDLLEEVAQCVSDDGNPDPLHRYRTSALDVRKPDRFTGKREPFHAYRIEMLIRDFLDGTTKCSRLEFLDRGDGKALVVIEFCKP
jgi:SAM-dependent methyltransferase